MRGKVTLVVGTNFGDEGKGKIIDYLAQTHNMVARATGGSNAGHKVVIQGRSYPLHLLPSGVFNPRAKVIIGNGVLVDPIVLAQEIVSLESDGLKVRDRLYISEKAHVIFPYHVRTDEIEENRRGDNKLGTTHKGIGPAAEDKYARDGIRFSDMKQLFTELNEKYGSCSDIELYEKFWDALCKLMFDQIDKHYNSMPFASYKNRYFAKDGELDDSIRKLYAAINILLPCICDTISLLHTNLENGQDLLIEGAQATLLDIDFGTYPFVTSSNPTASGMCTGVGIGPTYVSEVVGVLKAYASRVGEGVFITEQANEIGDKIRVLGHEYGTTTGRPRRCGWLDLVALKYACRVNGLTALAVNHLDTIGMLENFYVCVAYRDKETGEKTTSFSSENNTLNRYVPVYKEFEGNFYKEMKGSKSFEELPQEAINFLQFIADYTNVPVKYVGVGAGRDDLLKCNILPQK